MEEFKLIKESVSDYKHIDLGNIKLAFTQVCKEDIFADVYFAANSLYYVESGSAVLSSMNEKITAKKGEVVLIKQHSKLDIQKFKDKTGKDFKSVIFYLFPDFVTEFVRLAKEKKPQLGTVAHNIIHLGKPPLLTDFCESLLPLFGRKQLDNSEIKQKTFIALNHLSQYNALVNDVARNFWGRAAIQKWSDEEIIQPKVTFETDEVMEHYGDYMITALTDGEYDKTKAPDPLYLDYFFTIKDNKIIRMFVFPNKKKSTNNKS